MHRGSFQSLLFYLLCAVFITTTIAEESDGPLVTVRGGNLLQFARGDKNIYDAKKTMPWNYLADYLDFQLGIQHFFLKGRFQVDESSLNFNPTPAVFREFLSRRSLGFSTRYVTLQAGHCNTVFGKGLTLNLQEDVTIEKTNILDGLYATSTFPIFTMQVIAGRPIAKAGSIVEGDKNYRDNIIGINGELFPFQTNKKHALLSGVSAGGGIVYFGNNVQQPQSVMVLDTANGKHDTLHFGFQKRGVILMPSGSVNGSIKNVDFSCEGAWLNFRDFDTLMNQEAIINRANSHSLYTSLGISLFDFYILGEYKNYFFAKPDSLIKTGLILTKENPGYAKIKEYVEPPSVRYKHKWYLLTKQTKAPYADDVIGYGATVTWSHFQPTTIALAANIGGAHEKRDMDSLSFDYTCFGFSKQHRYWEGYLEWEQNYNGRLKSKIGIDGGRSDTAFSSDDWYAMAGAVLELGPFAQRHSMEFGAEFMHGTYYIPVNGVDQKRTAVQYLFSIAYSFSPYVTLGYKFEHETRQPYDNDFIGNKLFLPQTFHNYNSVALTVTSVQNHIIKIEYGGFSEGRKCNFGSCTTIPSFKGIRITATSTF